MKHFPILEGRCMVVELDDEVSDLTLPKIGIADLYFQRVGEHPPEESYISVPLPPGNWRIIGMLSEVTDAELADVTGFYYNKYNDRYVEMPTSAMRATPIGDIENAIRAEGYYLDENPIAVPDFSGGNIRFSETVEYAKAQSRVLDRSRCLLLGRED